MPNRATQNAPCARMLDVAGDKAIVALPYVIKRKDAEAIRNAHRDLFEFMPNSGSWITARGLTACQGITTKTVIVKVALHLRDVFFELIREIAAQIVSARSSTRRSAATA